MSKFEKKTLATMDRHPKEYPINEVFNWIVANPGKKKAEIDGHIINVNSIRYETFMQKGTTCCVCGLNGDHFYKERNFTTGGYVNDGPYHFNLYATTADGKEILMTKDHILAKSLGGKDHVSNMQTMCTCCNNEKSNMTTEQWEDSLKTKKGTEEDGV